MVISLPRSSISSEKVLFRVQVMKKKREKFTILKEVFIIFVCKYGCYNIYFVHAYNELEITFKNVFFFLSEDMFSGIGSAHPKITWHQEKKNCKVCYTETKDSASEGTWR